MMAGGRGFFRVAAKGGKCSLEDFPPWQQSGSGMDGGREPVNAFQVVGPETPETVSPHEVHTRVKQQIVVGLLMLVGAGWQDRMERIMLPASSLVVIIVCIVKCSHNRGHSLDAEMH
ncbi:unnamed protein product [Lampetra planeri]